MKLELGNNLRSVLTWLIFATALALIVIFSPGCDPADDGKECPEAGQTRCHENTVQILDPYCEWESMWPCADDEHCIRDLDAGVDECIGGSDASVE